MKVEHREFLKTQTPTCHAATIAFHEESPFFAWFGGQQEGLPDSSIYVQHDDRVDSLGKNDNVAYWNPILFTVKDKLLLAYKKGKFCDCWQTNILTLFEEHHQILPAGLNFCVKCKPIVDKYGTLWCGSSVETRWDWTSYIEKYEYSDGKLKFISRSNPLTVEKKVFSRDSYTNFGGVIKRQDLTAGIIQPSLWIDKFNDIHAVFRSSRGLDELYTSSVLDKGQNKWIDPLPLTSFKNPNSGVDTVYFNDRLFLIHNPSDKYRFPLVLSELNKDLEEIDSLVIKEEPEGNICSKELSYPYMIENDGKIHLVYTHGRKDIEYCIISID